ncbi:MAG: AAA family ATPase [archaeon]|nr:AAA family ATPase [archaeon]
MIITISGTAGSGKSTIAKKIEKILNATRIYVGGIRREMAREKGWTLEQLNEYAKDHPETDVDVDKRAADEAKKEEAEGKVVIVEGRVQYHFLPESLKIYIKVNPDEGAKRVWKELQEKGTSGRNEKGYTLEEMKVRVREREEEDAGRYLKYYNIDHRDESQYDFILDTTDITAEEATVKVLEYIKENG